MAGRPPKATHLLLLEGGFRADRHHRRKSEPKPEGKLGGPPDWLLPYAREAWDRGLRDAPSGLLKPLDQSVYTVWCVACGHHRQAAEALAKMGLKGLVITSGQRAGPRDAAGVPTILNGTPQVSP